MLHFRDESSYDDFVEDLKMFVRELMEEDEEIKRRFESETGLNYNEARIVEIDDWIYENFEGLKRDYSEYLF